MSLGLIEDRSDDATSSNSDSHEDFDWSAVEAAFDGQPLSPQDNERLQRALAFILDWGLSVDLDSHHALKSIGKRVVAMAWVIDPDRFKVESGADVISLRSLSRRLGFSAPNIAPLTADFSRLTKIFNQFQDHDWRKKKQQHEDNTQNETEEQDHQDEHGSQH